MQKKRITRAALLGAALIQGLTSTASGQGVVWMHESEGNSWLAETVTLGGWGDHVFTEVGAYANHRLLFSSHDAMPPAPVWDDGQFDFNFARTVDSASEADVQVAMHQEYVTTGSSERQAILHKFTSQSGDPDWTFEVPSSIYGHNFSDIRVSADGSVIVAAVLDGQSGRPVLWVFNPGSPIPIASHTVTSIYGWVTFDLSADGSRVVLSNSQRIVVVDVASGAEVDQIWIAGSPNNGSVAVNRDASEILFGTQGSLRVYADQTGIGYVLDASLALDTGEYCSRVAFSGDGQTLGVGINKAGLFDFARLMKVSRNGFAVELDYVVPSGGELQNIVSGLALSEGGDVLAAGLWGDALGATPELLVFEGPSGVPSYEHHMNGSVIEIDLSPDGERLAVASKSVHATEMGGGGAFWLFETRDRDFRLHGAPQIGSTVTFSQEHEAEAYGVVLSAPQLASEPQVFPGVGSLLLDAGSLSVLPSIVPTDGNGVAYVPHQIPNEASLVGTTSYYQGFGLRPRKLSEDFVRVTVLP